ncbi:hypothetical protein EJ06DRAFT_519680 [Trichodelitschia bisporula]|uniref:Uncharacterized protein n=1 Tax=Trichodelitschia bisporula TaxID=703511 RepID=A0A6G1I6X2_9PEZI|nr:hypothetical protein EJ06DRAFT_519680 [Trichodelitschia bisporula]
MKQSSMAPETTEVEEKTSTMTKTKITDKISGPKKQPSRAFYKKAKSTKRHDHHTARADAKMMARNSIDDENDILEDIRQDFEEAGAGDAVVAAAQAELYGMNDSRSDTVAEAGDKAATEAVDKDVAKAGDEPSAEAAFKATVEAGNEAATIMGGKDEGNAGLDARANVVTSTENMDNEATGHDN